MTDIKTNPIIDDAIHRASLSQDKLIFFKEHKVLTFLLTISGIGLLYLALVGYESYKASKNLKEKAVTQIANDAEFDRIAAVLRKCNISPQRVLESQQIKALFDPSKYQTIQRQLKRLEDPRSQTSIDKLLDQSVSLSLQIFEAETKKPDLTPFLVCLYSQDEDEEISDLLKSKKNLDFLLSRVEIERSSLPTSEELQKFYPRFKQIMDSNYFNLNRMNLDPSLPEIRKFELTRKQWTSKLLLQKPSDPATVLAGMIFIFVQLHPYRYTAPADELLSFVLTFSSFDHLYENLALFDLLYHYDKAILQETPPNTPEGRAEWIEEKKQALQQFLGYPQDPSEAFTNTVQTSAERYFSKPPEEHSHSLVQTLQDSLQASKPS